LFLVGIIPWLWEVPPAKNRAYGWFYDWLASARRRPRLRYFSIALWILNPDRTVGYRYEARAHGFARMFCRLHGGCSLPLSLASTKELAVAEDKLK
jgi:hypothetical protein